MIPATLDLLRVRFAMSGEIPKFRAPAFARPRRKQSADLVSRKALAAGARLKKTRETPAASDSRLRL